MRLPCHFPQSTTTDSLLPIASPSMLATLVPNPARLSAVDRLRGHADPEIIGPKPGCIFCDVSKEKGFGVVYEDAELIAFHDRRVLHKAEGPELTSQDTKSEDSSVDHTSISRWYGVAARQRLTHS
jgi:hypothetical protein